MPSDISQLTPEDLAGRLGPLLSNGSASVSELDLSQADLLLLGFEVTDGQAHIASGVERLNAEVITSSLTERASAWLDDFAVLQVVGSTNTHVSELAATTGIHGAVRIAELQVQGRGRRGRSWQSPYGQNLALSLGVRLPVKPDALAGFSLCAGLAAADALKSMDVPDVSLKWPNDVLARGRKISGILVEVFSAGSATDVVVGIGINFRIPAEARQAIDQPVIDLDELGGDVSRNALAAALISSLVDFSEGFVQAGFEPMRSTFDSLHHYQGQTCTLLLGDQQLEGRVRGVTAAGELELFLGGEIRTFNAGEVSLRPS